MDSLRPTDAGRMQFKRHCLEIEGTAAFLHAAILENTPAYFRIGTREFPRSLPAIVRFTAPKLQLRVEMRDATPAHD